jgi:RNA polymerase sigma factor (sigma-70 family)
LQECDRITTEEPFDRVAADELTSWLRAAVAQLPDQQATVFVMSHFEQLPRDDVSATLGISPEAVSTALFKARQSLLEQLNLFKIGESK